MSERPAISARDLSPEVRKKLGVKVKRRRARSSLTMHQVRTHALRVLAVVAELTPAERRKVLRHAQRINEL